MLLNEQLSDAARRHAFQLLERNAQAQAQLVNDLVDTSRMTTGKLTLNLEALPIVPALEAALESVRPSAQAKHLKLRTAWDALDVAVVADATRLQQVLWNLLSNAVKFTPSRGAVSIGAAEKAVDQAAGAGGVGRGDPPDCPPPEESPPGLSQIGIECRGTRLDRPRHHASTGAKLCAIKTTLTTIDWRSS